jgi:thiamine biosynthesis lipoprotein
MKRMAAKRSSNRRQFLKGRWAADALADRAEARPSPGDARLPVDHAGEPYLVQFGRRAMACQFEVFLNAGQHEAASQAALDALDLIDRLESQLTIYRETSEVARLNQAAFETDVVVEPRLFDLFERAVQLHRDTEGAFDITAGPLVKAWGFFHRRGMVPSEEQLSQALAAVGSQKLRLDPELRTVRFLAPGMEINLGAIGKGYALDRAAELLLAVDVENFLWHGGRSSLLARGSHETGSGWLVAIDHPLRPGRRVIEVCLSDRALGTSGAATQFFRHGRRRYGHILDPRTGRPAEGVYSATALAPSAAEADALATAFYILGVEGTIEYCQNHAGVGALLLVPGPDPGSVELMTAGLGPGDWKVVGSL